MAFLNPLLLLGTLSVSIPIIIHLLNRRKFDRIIWAAMRFLKISVEQNQRRLRIEDLILLIIRCALLALLAIALARPTMRAASAGGLFGQPKITAVLILDNSMSMGTTNGVSTRFDRAKQALQQAMDALPSGSSVALILASDKSDKRIPQPTSVTSVVVKELHDAKLTDRATNLFRSINDGIEILHGTAGTSKELFLATDGQFLAFQQMPDIVKALDAAKSEMRADVILTGEGDTHNLSVSSLTMGNVIPAVGTVLPIDVEVTNWGKETVHSVKVSLHVDNEPPCAETLIDKLSAGESSSVRLLATVRDDAYHAVTASIVPDRLTADDSRTLAVRGLSKVNVLLVDGNPGTEARESEVFFLRHAMIPVPKAQADDYVVKCTTVLPTDLSTQRLDEYQVVALADVAAVPQKTVDALGAFVTGGGGLMIFPGDNLLPASYNDQFGAAGLLPAEFGPTDGLGDADDVSVQPVRLAPKPVEHPIVSIFADPTAGDLTAAHFYKRYLLNPIAKSSEDHPAARVVLNFADGKPFMIERPLGRGRVIQFASTASTRWNDLPDHAGLWVTLMYRSLGWLVLENERQLNVSVGGQLLLHPAAEQLGKAAVITLPGDAAASRDSRQVSMDAQNQPTVVYQDTDHAGEYDVSVGEAPPVKFAAQADRNESDLTPINDVQRAQLAGTAELMDFKDGMDLKASLNQQRVGNEIWFPFAVAAMILAALETFLADWFSRPK